MANSGDPKGNLLVPIEGGRGTVTSRSDAKGIHRYLVKGAEDHQRRSTGEPIGTQGRSGRTVTKRGDPMGKRWVPREGGGAMDPLSKLSNDP